MTKVTLPDAKDTTGLAVRAGCDNSGKPEPTAREVQDYLDMHLRLESYLDGAAQQWVVDNGIPGQPKMGRNVSVWVDPEWQDELPDIFVYYYADENDRYDRHRSSFRIPVEDLLPEFGNALALMRALST